MSNGEVDRWAKPIFEAFVSGAWLLFWTKDTLFWVAKPKVHVDRSNGQRRLHNPEYAAVESDVENMYFLDGVLVPAFVVTRPEWITTDHIKSEENTEVRRVMIDRFGLDRWIADQNATLMDEIADPGQLEPGWLSKINGVAPEDYLRDHPDKAIKLYELEEEAYGGKLKMLHVRNGTPERDGSHKWYWITPPQDAKSALDAVVATYPGLTTEQYFRMVRT